MVLCGALLVLPVQAQMVGDTYGVDGAGNLHQIDPSSGSIINTVAISGLGADSIVGTDFGPGGILFAVGRQFASPNTNLYTVDLGTGAATLLAPITQGGSPYTISDISFSPGGVLFGLSGTQNGNEIVTIDVGTGVVTTIGASGIAGGGNGLTFGPGGVLYAADGTSIYTVDPGTGAATAIAASPGTIGTLSWDGVSATFLGQDAAFTGTTFEFDAAGNSTVLPALPVTLFSIGVVRAVSASVVPTLGEWGVIFMSLALAGLAALRFRKISPALA